LRIEVEIKKERNYNDGIECEIINNYVRRIMHGALDFEKAVGGKINMASRR
jgi:hypothetical protein